MRIDAPDRLATLLFGRGRQAVLAKLFANPDRRYFMGEIARAAGATPSVVQRDLAALTEAGILQRTSEGRQVYYQANPDCPIFPELKGIVAKTFGVADVLRTMLAPHAAAIDVAFIYGSVASGEQTSKSDIDVLIVGSLQIANLSEALLDAETRLGRPVNPTVYARSEFVRKTKGGDHFLGKILQRPMIFLIGERRDLERLL